MVLQLRHHVVGIQDGHLIKALAITSVRTYVLQTKGQSVKTGITISITVPKLSHRGNYKIKVFASIPNVRSALLPTYIHVASSHTVALTSEAFVRPRGPISLI